MEVPRIVKITINMGVGEAAADKKILMNAMADLGKIAGQKWFNPWRANLLLDFKIREGWPIGCKVTLRRDKMYEFLDRLITIALPRVRDFRGISARSFDGRGNYSLGLKNKLYFLKLNTTRLMH